MSGPPEDVMTALLEGGSLDGLVYEIEPGQETMELSPLGIESVGGRPEASGPWMYRFTGRVDAEGRAVFVEAEE